MFRWIAMRGMVQTIMVVMVLLLTGYFNQAGAQSRPPVRLVLQITVDELRGDLINRYANGFGKGGFRLLVEKGVYYTNAHYQHANTETILGYSTLATGTFPSVHGMVGNVWFDRETGELAHNIEDSDHPLLPTRDAEQKGEQVDPAQKKSRTQGPFPRAILAPTIGDTLAAYYGGRSKIFGISGKDRSAVFIGPGIHATVIDRLVHPVDVAPTIAAFVGITPPGSSQGTSLEEVLK